ncbi:MAG: DNA alkylation repair protein [Flavobacteriales bacterium]|nr:DNA alkylation repair protein [Flavobacteriales bacterium]
MDSLKDMFDFSYYKSLSTYINIVYKKFNKDAFFNDVTHNLDKLELNQRLRNTTVQLKKHLPNDYKESLEILYEVIKNYDNHYRNLVFPDFVALYGHNDFEISMKALEYFTCFGSSEFAIRTFLKNDFSKTLKVMEEWSKSENNHVRRLSSEGCRSRLPWSFKFNEVIENPNLTRRILENLKEDKELYVRKSVANHINDISKDNEKYAIELIKSWNLKNPNTLWIAKHAMRNLIKQGNKEVLEVFGYSQNAKVNIIGFRLKNNKIKLGEYLDFEFEIESKDSKKQELIIDYSIYYLKNNQSHSKKVFKLKTASLEKEAKIKISKKQLFRDFSTRKHYLGTHFLEIQINGVVVQEKVAFDII